MTAWEIVRSVDAPDRHAACAAAIASPDQDGAPWAGQFFRDLYPSYFPPGSLRDVGFVLCHQRRPVARVEAVLDPAGRLTRHGRPLRIALAPDAGELAGPAVGQVLDGLVGEVQSSAPRPAFLEIEDLAVTGLMSAIGLTVMKRGGHPVVEPWPILDLRRPEAELLQAVRPSYRTNIDWGRRHLALLHFNQAAPDPGVFAAGIDFLAAQGTVMAPATAAGYRERIASGHGEATLIRHEGRLVGCILIVDDGGIGFYAAAAFDAAAGGPGTGRPPLGHWPLWEAIRRCRTRGCRSFELYRVFFRGQERPGYRFGTAHFKLGFTDTVRQRMVWRLPLDQEPMRFGDA